MIDGVNIERKNRILIALAAYSYEMLDNPFMSDGDFDALALSICKEKSTGHKIMDSFFKKEFCPYTGCWIHKHPELNKIINLYNRLYGISRA